MYLKQLRQKKHLSQEQLAENCKLSLRTVQRIEAGHRVGYTSLRALSAEFSIEVDDLERELYAMKNTENEYTELPLWVRVRLGRGWRAASRQVHTKIERSMLLFAILLAAISFVMPEKQTPIFGLAISDIMIFGALSQFVGAYWVSIGIRIGDKYGAWPAVESTLPGGFFGYGKHESH